MIWQPTSTTEEAGFLAALEEAPDSREIRRAYADWLMQRDDLRGRWLEAHEELWAESLKPRRCRELQPLLRKLARECDPQWLMRVARISFSEMRRRVQVLANLDPARKLFAAGSHRYELKPPLELEQLARLEAGLGLRLPEQYRRFVTEFANGGAGPAYGIVPLAKTLPSASRASRLNEPFPVPKSAEDSPGYGAPPGALEVCETGCGGYYWLITAGPDREVLWQQGSEGDWWPLVANGHAPEDQLLHFDAPRAARLEFIDWYINWLDDARCELLRAMPDGDDVFDVAPEGVTDLNFSGRGLTSLPDGVRKLRYLRKLNLNDNKLTALPDWLGELTHLEELHIAGNSLKTLPASIGELHALTRIRAQHNQLESLPETLGQLRALNTLDLSYNRLTALPESIGDLVELDYIRINSNLLSTLPASFGRLVKVECLDLSFNQLTTLPAELSALHELSELNLRKNALRLLPEAIGQLPKLERLILNENPELDLADACRKLSHASTLRELQLINLGLDALPDEIGLLGQLVSLAVSYNRISRLPGTFANLTRLRDFSDRSNPADLDGLARELIPGLNQDE
ncbi:MAG TPA: leucine-rich repeat domain-containing protein [Polyangiaceae bacterium]|nr:leucine-rich repeat domain-containing protein [Polyangiaceae bacterium]